jgi:LysM repeat protein
MVASLPQGVSAAPPAAKEECNFYHAVQRGDTLKRIESRYGYSVDQIVARNDMKKPYTIYVGQRLCIPSKVKKNVPKVASQYTNKSAVFFAAGRNGDDILLYTYNYPKTTALVKVENAGDAVWKLVTVASIKTQNGKQMRLKLPREVRYARYLLVCLKDKTSGNLQCVVPRSGP